jgi:hypothetical protein
MNMKQNNKIEEMLSSLDGCSKATAPDFFYTRLKARMEKQSAPAPQSWVMRPAFAILAIVAVLLINAIVLLRQTKTTDNPVVSDTDTYQSVAMEYSLNENTTPYELIADK